MSRLSRFSQQLRQRALAITLRCSPVPLAAPPVPAAILTTTTTTTKEPLP
jgi:hypothetical protein